MHMKSKFICMIFVHIILRRPYWARQEQQMSSVVCLVMLVGTWLWLFLLGHAAAGHLLQRPDPDDAKTMARWLVKNNNWGVVSTVSVHLNGIPFGNVASYSDGPPDNSTGIPYFYLSYYDPTPRDVAIIPYASLTVSEAPLGTCGSRDVENPTCAKITLSGQMHELEGDTQESDFAALALFSKHPEMKDWPEDHNFKFYGLKIQDIYLIDWYGGAKTIPVDEYRSLNGHSLL